MKTQVHNKLKFNKNAVTELNDLSLSLINGGGTLDPGGTTNIPGSRFTTDLCDNTRG